MFTKINGAQIRIMQIYSSSIFKISGWTRIVLIVTMIESYVDSLI